MERICRNTVPRFPGTCVWVSLVPWAWLTPRAGSRDDGTCRPWQDSAKGSEKPLLRDKLLAPEFVCHCARSELKVQPDVPPQRMLRLTWGGWRAWWRLMDRERKGASPDLWSALDWGQRWIKPPKREKNQCMDGAVKEESSACLQPCITYKWNSVLIPWK